MAYNFDQDKAMHLDKMLHLDKSAKGSVDMRIRDLLDAVNALPDFFTTSSCAGRIRVLAYPADAKKNQVRTLFSTHEPVTDDDLERVAAILAEGKKGESAVWWLQESAILHIAARDIVSARRLVVLFQQHGFKRAAYLSLARRPVIEIVNTDQVEAPLAKDGVRLAGDAYLSALQRVSNGKLLHNFSRVERLTALLKERRSHTAKS